MKKIIAIVTLLCLVVSMMSVTAFAAGAAAETIEGKGTAALTDIMGKTSFGDVISFALYTADGEKITYAGVLDTDRASETYLTQLQTDEAKALVAEQGWSKANTPGSGAVKIVEQPADSTLTEADVNLEWVSTVLTIKSAKEITAEGTYTFEVTLDNGTTATASCNAKGFTTPAQLRIVGTTCVELGAPAYLKATWYDANGVPKNATNAENVEWTVTGAAGYHYCKAATRYAIFASADDADAGKTIEVTVTDKDSGLTAKHTVKVAAAGEKTLTWNTTDAAANEDNAYTVTLMDANGDAVKLCCCATTVEYTVLSQPEGANVVVGGSWKNGTQGQSGAMTLTSDKNGEVTVQAVVTFTKSAYTVGEDGTAVENKAGTIVYTGVETFHVTGAAETTDTAAEQVVAPQTGDASVIALFAAAAACVSGAVISRKRRA